MGTVQKNRFFVVILVVLLAILNACGDTQLQPQQEGAPTIANQGTLEPISLGAGQKLKVVATTNIVGDVVRQVGGDSIDLVILMGAGVDPHTYVPTPADTAAVYDAHVVLANGAGLEAGLEEILETAGGQAVAIYLSDGLELLSPVAHTEEETEANAPEDDHGDADPHVWFSVPNVVRWVETIHVTLSTLDPGHAQVFEDNAGAYTRRLEELDGWIKEQIAQIPEANRKLVTNHPAFGYLAARYGLEQIGAVYPISPASEPSAQDLAALQEAIRQFGIPAVFSENTVNPRLAEQIAADTGIRLVPLFTGSLGGPGSGAESYIELMQFDTNSIVQALKSR